MDKEKITVNKMGQNEDVVEMKAPQNVIEEHHSHIAPIIGVLVIVLVIILGGLYLWGAALTKDGPLPVTRDIQNNEPETVRAVADEQILETVSPSDSLNAIETDIESTNLESLDSELITIEAELDAALQGN